MKHEAKIFVDMDGDEEEGPEGDRSLCPYAEKFMQWANELYKAHSGTTVKIAQAKVLLLDKYYDWRNFVPKSHRLHTGERGHFCIFHVMDHAYCQLRLAELALNPPMLFLPAPSAPPGDLMPEGTIFGLKA